MGGYLNAHRTRRQDAGNRYCSSKSVKPNDTEAEQEEHPGGHARLVGKEELGSLEGRKAQL